MVIGNLALAALSTYAASGSALWLAQRRLVFGKPTRIRALTPGPLAGQHAVHDLRLAVAPAVSLQGWCALPEAAMPRRVLIYFGGRNEHVGWAPGMASYLGAWSIYAFNYRGFGTSGGRPSEANAKADALAIYDEVVRLHGTGECEIAVMGRSLGTAMAMAVAARREVQHLVLLSPFESLLALMRGRPLLRSMRWTLNQTFDCRADALALRARSAVLLAERDTRIPHASSLALWQTLRHPEQLARIAGTNHQSLPRHPETQARVAEFLNR